METNSHFIPLGLTLCTGDAGSSSIAASGTVNVGVSATLLDGRLGADTVGPAQDHLSRLWRTGPVPGFLRRQENGTFTHRISRQRPIPAQKEPFDHIRHSAAVSNLPVRSSQQPHAALSIHTSILGLFALGISSDHFSPHFPSIFFFFNFYFWFVGGGPLWSL